MDIETKEAVICHSQNDMIIEHKIEEIIGSSSEQEPKTQQQQQQQQQQQEESMINHQSEIVEYKYIGSNIETDNFNDLEMLNCLQCSPELNQISLILAKNITDTSIGCLFELKPQLVSLEIVHCTSLTTLSLNIIMQSRTWFDSMKSLSLRYFDDINHFYVINILERYNQVNEFDFRNNYNLDIKECIRYMINPENYMDGNSNDESYYTVVNHYWSPEKQMENEENEENEDNEDKKREVLVMCSIGENSSYSSSSSSNSNNNCYLVIENKNKRLVFHLSK